MPVRRLVAVLGTAALIWAVIALSPVGAKPEADDVRVTNGAEEPVPVTGTVGATQSGPWSVGIAGTTSVTFAGTPAVTVVDTREPFEASADELLGDGESSGTATFVLPADKRFVAEFLSVTVTLEPDQTPIVSWNTAGGATGGFLPLEFQGTTSGSDHYSAAIPILDFTEPGGSFYVSLFRQNPSSPPASPGTAILSAYVSGYLQAA
jgi:hypothetical protein